MYQASLRATGEADIDRVYIDTKADWLPTNRVCGCPEGRLNCLSRRETFELGSTVLNIKRRHRWKERHSARFIPELPERYIKLFSHAGDTVLDPFCGSGTTNVVAKELGRNSVGIDVNPYSAKMSFDRVGKTGSSYKTIHSIFTGDARNVLGLLPNKSIDLIVTSPPYLDVVDYGHDDTAQLGNIGNYQEFIDAMAESFEQAYRVLKDGKYMVVNTQDLYKKTVKAPLHSDYINICKDIGFELNNINIYILNYSNGGRLVFGYPLTYYPKNDHEFNLIFKK